jgi:hypothetical protein
VRAALEGEEAWGKMERLVVRWNGRNGNAGDGGCGGRGAGAAFGNEEHVGEEGAGTVFPFLFSKYFSNKFNSKFKNSILSKKMTFSENGPKMKFA